MASINKIKRTIKVNCSQISTIFFDLDNTLIPTRKGDSRACSKVCDILVEQHSIPYDQAVQCTTAFLKAFRRCPDNVTMPLSIWRQHLWSLALPATHQHLVPSLYAKWIDYRYRYLMLTPEIVALLQSLRECYQLAVITNGPSNAQWEKIDRLDLHGLFDEIVVSGDLPWEKPDPKIFLATCHRLGVAPENCVMIGDKIDTDIQGGKDAKLGASIWIPLTASAAAAAAAAAAAVGTKMDIDDEDATTTPMKPDFIIQSLDELIPILQSLNGGSMGMGNIGGGVGASSSNSSISSYNKRKSNGGRKTVPYNRRVIELMPPPDLESGNSNSSDGS